MGKHVDYFVSLNSPWTYLGSARFDAMCAKYGADVTIWPVSFGDVFAVSGGLPLPKRAPQRQAYRMMELKRWREHLGIPIQLEPRFFPSNEVPAAHAVIAVRESMGNPPAIKLAHAVLKALWEEEKNPGDTATLNAIITSVGLDAAKVTAMAADPAIAARREADTKKAIERGVFGAPSYVIDNEIFWGQDRVEFVERKLAKG